MICKHSGITPFTMIVLAHLESDVQCHMYIFGAYL